MKIGDLVRYAAPVTGKHEWIGVVLEIVKPPQTRIWVKVHWYDGLQRWEEYHRLELTNESG